MVIGADEPSGGTRDDRDRGFLSALVADGRPLLAVTAVALVACGAVAMFLAATGHFLPQDVQYLGMSAADLCSLNGCRIVHFMEHDRTAFGGALVAIGILYLWLVTFPLGAGEPWAWWTLALSGGAGFASFLAYLGYGYLDTWHGAATLALLPCYGFGLMRARGLLPEIAGFRTLTRPAPGPPWISAGGLGRLLLITTGAGMLVGGGTVLIVGMTSVFVPQDLRFMGIDEAGLLAINPRLIPLIAHDRAGFGGAIGAAGLTVLLCVWRGRASRSLWQALALAAGTGFIAAIGVHFLIGYTDLSHLAPAYLGAAICAAGLALFYPACCLTGPNQGR
jgi:hypothetical protein